MKESIRIKLENFADRHEEIATLLGQAEIISDQTKFRELSKEYAQLEPLVENFSQYTLAQTDLEESELLSQDSDPDMKAMAVEEIKSAKKRIVDLEESLQLLLLPKDPNDNRNIYIEVRAGTGGDEASIFAGDLFRMYSRFAETKRWEIEVISANHGEHGGYKEVIARVIGSNVYQQLKFESGVHRVQRVPETESQGRIHTSACTIAILPEVDEINDIPVRTEDLRIDTFRASGAGGQHVNKTDSAIRITHLPTGVVVECQDDRSQHKNKAKALTLLKTRLLDAEQQKQHQEQSDKRKSLVGSGDRSERIRTYNYPQGRVTDHRINLTLYKLPEIVEGDLQQIIEPLLREHQTSQLADLASENN